MAMVHLLTKLVGNVSIHSGSTSTFSEIQYGARHQVGFSWHVNLVHTVMSWSCVIYGTKKQKPSSTRSSEPPIPHFVPTRPIASKISWTLSSLDLCTCTKFDPDRFRCSGIITTWLIFRTPKVITIAWSLYAGFQSTIILYIYGRSIGLAVNPASTRRFD